MQKLMAPLVTGFMMLLAACGGKVGSENDLVGDWVVSDVSDTLSMYSAAERAKLHDWLYGKSWTFTAEHTYQERDLVDTIGHGGNWTYDPESGLLEFYDSLALEAQPKLMYFFPPEGDSPASLHMPLTSGDYITMSLKHPEP